MHEKMTNRKVEPSHITTREYAEGKIRFILPIDASGRSGVFYNPKMSFNRDFAILFASSHFLSSRHLRVCDPMTATGVRAARYVLECPNVTSVVAADNQSETVAVASSTIRLNGLAEKITVVESDANLILLNHLKERFDLVDLDPFGSPAPYFECALRATLDGGVVAATATDMGPLTGARARACSRKYGITPIRTEFEKEVAIRILSANLAISAGRLELGIEVVFSHASDHYARIYAAVRKGRALANLSARSLGFLEYCPECLMRVARSSLDTIRNECENCGAKTKVGGPIWLGHLWSPHTVQTMVERTPFLRSSRLSEIQNILTLIDGEQKESPFYYRTDAFSSKLSLRPPAVKRVLASLHEAGFRVSRTHFHANGFRTNATCREIVSILKSLAKEA